LIEPFLHDPVLSGVVREDHSHTAGHQTANRLVKGAGQLVQFTIDLDPDRLEGAFGGMATTTTGRGGNGLADQLGQPGRVGYRACGHHSASDPTGITFVGMSVEDPSQLGFLVPVYNLSSGKPLAPVHPHV